MIGELGHLALVLAFAVATVQGVVPLLGAWRRVPAWTAVAVSAAKAQFLLIGIAYLCLTYMFVVSDFSFSYVAQNSNTALPLVYKISAVWGAHEGSMLLWAAILGGWGFAVAIFSTSLPDIVRARVLAVMALVSVGFYLFMLLTSNPFERILPAPPEGRDLNPLLQDPGMAGHPPLLYMGYVGLVVPFSFAVAALLEGRIDLAWTRWTRPWTTVALGVPHGRHHARKLVGVQRARVGRLVVLGSRRERVVHAVARGDRADPLAGGHGAARRVPRVDPAPRDHRVLPEPARSLPRTLRACWFRFMHSPPIRPAGSSSSCSWRS